MFKIYLSSVNKTGSKTYTDINAAITAAKETAKQYKAWTKIVRV